MNSSFGNLIGLLFLAAIGFGIYRYMQAREADGDWRMVKNLPPSVQGVVAKMDPETQTTFFNELGRKRKSLPTAYLFGTVGWHYLYLGKVGLQFAFWLTGGGGFVWWFADLFRMPSLVRDFNEQCAREAIHTLAIGTAFSQRTA